MLDNFKIGEKVLIEAVITSMSIDENGEMYEVKILGTDNEDYLSYICFTNFNTIHKIEE